MYQFLPTLSAMALKLQSNAALVLPAQLAVHSVGAMALKRSVLHHQHIAVELAVPFHGAMALKRKTRLSHPHERHPCSPLPRGDGAETPMAAFWQETPAHLQS